MKSYRKMSAALALAVASMPAIAVADPLVLGHRGASAYRPEHTLASYALAIDQGADYIEPDLVSTRDGILVARHENEIGGTTDVGLRAEFAGRRAVKMIDGVSITGWFTEDFTLAELKTLKAKERIPGTRPGNAAYDGQFEVPTLQEVIDLVRQKEASTGRTIGIIPETKHPTYFDSIGLSLEEPLLATLNANGYNGASDRVIIQSFEVGNLQFLNGLTDIRLVQLTGGAAGRPYDFTLSGDTRTYGDLLSVTGLNFINDYAELIGPEKGSIIPRDAAGFLLSPTSLVGDAHAAGLLVTPYTFRPENIFLPADFRIGANPNAYGDQMGELMAFLDAGVDGIFVDAPDLGRAAVDRFVAGAVPEPASWAMMIVGMGAIGASLRAGRRRRHALAMA
ncbi:glycerophosphodiester phosphodiesterase family protein [uncultured Sphingomonas sp.]|uniref:glycerophosphodiester phosphodiesterase family protein n=1 Tax=uncultured Sphingomonas sp. TaxID=158754 RepID=UPI0035CC5A4B